MRNGILVYLNGQKQDVSDEKAGWMLADYLRYERGLTGTKIVCAEGDCGACTVLRYFPRSGTFLPINSCITTMAQMDGSSLVTVDALSSDGSASSESLTEVQKAMMGCHGSQCGFCTPGFVMALTGLVEKRLEKGETTQLEKQEAKNALTGNLCRCTGYEPILDAARAVKLDQCESVRDRFHSSAQEKELKKALASPVAIETEEFSFFAPLSLKEAARYLSKNKDVRILAGGTDLGVVHNKRKLRLKKNLSLHLIPELYLLKRAKGRVLVGARVTLSELRLFVKSSVPELARLLDIFASPQIKNVATLVGNVCNGSPIGDMMPFLLATDAKVHIVGPKGKRTIGLDRFYLGYRKTVLKRGELVAAIEFEEPKKDEKLKVYKISQRRDLDISTVNAAFWVRSKGSKIDDLRIALGGMAATPVRLKKTEKILKGSVLNAGTLDRACEVFTSESAPISDLRGTGAFRRVVSENLFQRFFREHFQQESV
jgi:xanthine dehydrogenase small subunit